MFRTAWIVAFSVLWLTTPSIGQQANVPASIRLGALRQRAEQGDAAARFALGKMYFDGDGVKRDYAEAGRWYECPKPSEEILASCRESSYKDLPPGAIHLLTKMKCDVGSNYDYGSAVELNGRGTPAYEMCCHQVAHGACSSVLVGKIGAEWKDLTAEEGLLGFAGACNLFIALESVHDGFHDVCLPVQCSTPMPAKGKTCVPTIWQFSNGRYRPVAYRHARPPE